MRALASTVRYAFRSLRRSPGFALLTVILLALGIGANTAIFSLVRGVLLKPLPFPEPDRIVSVPHTPPQDIFPGRATFAVSPANYLDWKAQNDVFSGMTITTDGSMTLTGLGEPESVPVAYVSSEFFDVLGARPVVGRFFLPREDDEDRGVIVLSEGFWRSRFGGNPSALGAAITLGGRSFTVVGIASAEQTFPENTRLWVPLTLTPKDRATRGIHDYRVLARLKPGVTLAAARAQMNAISARLAATYPEDDKGWGAAVIPLHEELVGEVRPALLVLLGAVGFVLLIACANVANLVLARTLGRRKEIAVRVALGAGRRATIEPIVLETALLALAGGLLGLVGARYGIRVMAGVLADRMPRVSEIRLDGVVLAFTAAVSVTTGVLSGLVPAWRIAREDPNETLKQGGRSESDAGSPAMRNALVAAEVALALVLMTGAGLLLRSLERLRGVDPGFEPRRVLTALVPIADDKYSVPEARRAFFERVLERVRALPGVESAATINTLPLTPGGSTQPVAIAGRPAAKLSEQPEVAVRVVSPEVWRTLRVPLREGRDFGEADRASATGAVIVSETMAKRFWPGESAVGKRLTLTFSPELSREVVGVVADVKLLGLSHREPVAALYVPHAQMPTFWNYLVVRTGPSPGSLARAVTAAVRAVDPQQPVDDVRTYEDFLGGTLAAPRFQVNLLSAFAGLALTLAAAGIYGVVAYGVRRRTREIGIRVALGASATAIVRLIVAQGMRPALLGLLAGAAASLALARALSRLLFGIGAYDPTTLGAVSALLAAVALAACVLPALRAARVDPTVALTEG